MSLSFFLYVFTQWWKWIVPTGILLASLSVVGVLYLYVPKYEATALILIESREPYIAFKENDDRSGDQRYVETQIELLRSPVILLPVLSNPEVASIAEFRDVVDPISYLKERLAIKQVGKSDLYDVRYVSGSPEGAALVVNTIVSEYLSMQSDEAFRRSQRVIDVLEEERLRRSTEVERLRGQVLKLAKDVTGRDPFGEGAVTDFDRAMPPTGGLYESLTEVEVQREVLKAELQSLRESAAIMPKFAQSEALLDLEIAGRADVQALEQKIDKARLAMDYIKTKKKQHLWQEDPRYQEAHADHQKYQQELDHLKNTVRNEMLAARQEEHKAKCEQTLAAKQQELASLETTHELLTQRYEDKIAELQSGGAQSVQLEFARSELAREESVFELIAARKLAMQTELRAPARVTLKQSATVPALAIEPIPYKLLAMASLASLLCPFALAVAREMTVKRIATPEQLADESQLSILAEIARFPIRPVASKESRRLSASVQRQMMVFAESIDSLRTNLILSERFRNESDKSVIAICSAASGEGKSSVATALAASFSGATKQRTLIIDCDLRSPDVARVLGTPTAPGLTEVLVGKAQIESAIFRVSNSNTYVLPAGLAKVNPHHIVQEVQFRKLIESLQETFPTIILDTPPVLGASESLVFAKVADLVVLCCLNDVSRAKQVRLAVDRLHSTGANLAGAVLSGISASRYSLVYGYYENRET